MEQHEATAAPPAAAADRLHRVATALSRAGGTAPWAVALALLAIYALMFLPLLPNEHGAVGADYSEFLPDLLTGYFWFLHNGLSELPWFSPSQCGGEPFYGNPQNFYLSVPQLLSFVVSPLLAVQATFLGFALAGYCGAYVLLRRSFATSSAAAVLGGALFMFNGFYLARMLIGHLAFHCYMLLPALAAALLPPPRHALRLAEVVLRLGAAALLLAMIIQGGMVQALPPSLLSLLVVGLIHAGWCGWRWFPPLGLLAAGLGAAALSAAKLTAELAYLAQFQRNLYPLPGIPGLAMVPALAFRTLFLLPPADPEGIVANGAWAQTRAEWEYSVSPVPLLFIGAALIVLVPRLRGAASARLLAGLGAMLLLTVPLLLNWYQPSWNAVLKSLPYFRSVSTLLRWFSAYILVGVVATALALDILPQPPEWHGVGRPMLAAGGIVLLLLFNLRIDRSEYGPLGAGAYSVATVQQTYARVAATGVVPPITRIQKPFGINPHDVSATGDSDAMTAGASQLLCDQPMFGYRHEALPLRHLHDGPVLDVTDGELNLRNAACDLFPVQNACAPGDAFRADQVAAARAFVDYRPYPFRAPGYFVWAKRLNMASLVALLAAMAIAGVCLRPKRRAAA